MNAVIQNYANVIKNATNFSDRASRREYWLFFLANFTAGILLSIVDGITGIPILAILFILAMLVPGIAVAIRRLHDGGRSGWWLLVSLVPILGPIALLVLMVLPGSPGANQFGSPVMDAIPREFANA